MLAKARGLPCVVADLRVCSPDWTRTSNLPINSRLLCQLSYRGMLRVRL